MVYIIMTTQTGGTGSVSKVWQASVPLEVNVEYDVPEQGVLAAMAEVQAASSAQQRLALEEQKQLKNPSFRGSA